MPAALVRRGCCCVLPFRRCQAEDGALPRYLPMYSNVYATGCAQRHQSADQTWMTPTINRIVGRLGLIFTLTSTADPTREPP